MTPCWDNIHALLASKFAFDAEELLTAANVSLVCIRRCVFVDFCLFQCGICVRVDTCNRYLLFITVNHNLCFFSCIAKRARDMVGTGNSQKSKTAIERSFHQQDQNKAKKTNKCLVEIICEENKEREEKVL